MENKKCIIQSCPHVTIWNSLFCNNHLPPSDLSALKRHVQQHIERGLHLQQARLDGLDLSSINFQGCDLTEAWLDNANLTKADLSKAILESTNLFGTTRNSTIFPRYFNIELLEKYDRICSSIWKNLDAIRQIDTDWSPIGRREEFQAIFYDAKQLGISIDPRMETQTAMNIVFDYYIKFKNAYMKRQYPSGIIESIDRELMQWLAKYPRDLYKLHPQTVERVVTEIFSDFGFECELTARTRDGGFDMVGLHQLGPVDTKIIVEVKRYQEEKKISVGVVRKLLGTMVMHHASHGFVVTTSYFTDPAKKEAEKYGRKPFMRESVYRLELVDFERFKEWIRGYVELTDDKPRSHL